LIGILTREFQFHWQFQRNVVIFSRYYFDNGLELLVREKGYELLQTSNIEVREKTIAQFAQVVFVLELVGLHWPRVETLLEKPHHATSRSPGAATGK
jgi:hypothetical protein